MRKTKTLLIVPVLALAAACRHAPPALVAAPAPAAAPAGPSLFTRLGGLDAIRAVAGDLVDRVAADARINGFFRGVDLDALKGKLTEQLCQVTGGPCRYTGRPMRQVHADLAIGDADFDALVSDLAASLDRFQVGAGEQAQLLRTLGGLRGEIVTRR